jgi:hypothetical protein
MNLTQNSEGTSINLVSSRRQRASSAMVSSEPKSKKQMTRIAVRSTREGHREKHIAPQAQLEFIVSQSGAEKCHKASKKSLKSFKN